MFDPVGTCQASSLLAHYLVTREPVSAQRATQPALPGLNKVYDESGGLWGSSGSTLSFLLVSLAGEFVNNSTNNGTTGHGLTGLWAFIVLRATSQRESEMGPGLMPVTKCRRSIAAAVGMLSERPGRGIVHSGLCRLPWSELF